MSEDQLGAAGFGGGLVARLEVALSMLLSAAIDDAGVEIWTVGWIKGEYALTV
jgi:hypothetical protein